MSLELTRKEGEAIVLPTVGARVVVRKIKAKGVQVGVEAPANVVVMREELLGQRVAPVKANRMGLAQYFVVWAGESCLWISQGVPYFTALQAGQRLLAHGELAWVIPDGVGRRAIQSVSSEFDAIAIAGGSSLHAFGESIHPGKRAALARLSEALNLLSADPEEV